MPVSWENVKIHHFYRQSSQPTLFLHYSQRFQCSNFKAIFPAFLLKPTTQLLIPLPRSESQATLLFCPPPLHSPCVHPDGAMLITSDLTVIGPGRLHQGDSSTVGEGPASLNKPLWPWSEVQSHRSRLNEQYETGREPGIQTVHLPSIIWAHCCAHPEALWLHHLLVCQGGVYPPVALCLSAQFGQRGRVHCIRIKEPVCSRQGWNWSITRGSISDKRGWEWRGGTEGFPFITYFSLCPL